MIKIQNAFSFVPPQGWNESRKGGAIVFKRPERELSVSAWVAPENESQKKRIAEVDELMNSALKEIEKDGKNPNLIAELPLERMDENDLEFWIQSFVTRDTTMLVCSAVARSATAVLLATMNVPNKPEFFKQFVEFLQSVKAIQDVPSAT